MSNETRHPLLWEDNSKQLAFELEVLRAQMQGKTVVVIPLPKDPNEELRERILEQFTKFRKGDHQ